MCLVFSFETFMWWTQLMSRSLLLWSSSLANVSPSCLSFLFPSVHLTSGARVRGQMWRASSVGSLFSSVWKVTLNVTSACASSVNATPLPSGRSRGWERLRDPRGALGKGGGGAFRGGPGGARSFPLYCERGNILTPVGVKALHFMGS